MIFCNNQALANFQKIVRLLVPVLLLLVVSGVDASADFYRYYDESGGVNVTNDYKSIPQRYRGAVTVVTDRELEKRSRNSDRTGRGESSRNVRSQTTVPHNTPSASAPSVPASPSAAEKSDAGVQADPGGGSWLSRQIPMLKVAAVVVLLIGAVVVAGRAVSAFVPRQLAIIIRVALFAALAVYLVKGMSGRVSEAFSRIKEDSNTAQKAVDRRSEKIKQQAE